MFFLFFSAFGCDLCHLVIQLTITTFLISFLGTINYNDTITTITMPVTTRSQVKLLTGSTNDLSHHILTGSTELSNFSSRSISPQHSSQLSSPLVLSVSSTSSSIHSSNEHCYFGEDSMPRLFQFYQAAGCCTP